MPSSIEFSKALFLLVRCLILFVYTLYKNTHKESIYSPESLILHNSSEAAQILSSNYPVVREGEYKVDNNTAPDGHVVPYGPVLGVQGNLKKQNELSTTL